MSTSCSIKKLFSVYTCGQENMDGETYVRIFKELGILSKKKQNGKLNVEDLQNIFTKTVLFNGRQRCVKAFDDLSDEDKREKVKSIQGQTIDYNAFFNSLTQIAEKKGVETTKIVDRMTSSTLPCYDGKPTIATPPKDGFCHDSIVHISHAHLPAVGSTVELVRVPIPTPVVCNSPRVITTHPVYTHCDTIIPTISHC